MSIPLTLIFLDDDPAILNSFKRSFRNSDFNCLFAVDEMELFSLAKDKSIDLLISDINMPGIQIEILLEKFKKLHKESEIILLSGKKK